MILLDKIEKGIAQADKGNVISEEDLDKEIDEWSK
jgi:predicted transcriptional regulator